MPKPKKNLTDKVEKCIEKNPDTEEYAIVTKVHGRGQFGLKLMNGKDIIGKLRGKLKKKKCPKNESDIRVDIDSIVLVSFRDFQSNIVDIQYVLKSHEIKTLKKEGKITFDSKHDTDDLFEEEPQLDEEFFEDL